MAIMGGAIAGQSLALRAWSATCVYVTIYGVAFLFMAGPATQSLSSTGTIVAQRYLVFGMWLVTAIVLTVGALLVSYTLDMMMERRFERAATSGWRMETAFAVRGVVFALLAAALFVGVASLAVGAVTGSLLWAATLAFVVPGVLAGGLTHTLTPGVMAEKRQLASVSVFAIAVVGVANYVMVGAAQPLNVALGA
jgi:hypothetical protein